MQNYQFKIKDNNGIKVCDIIATYHDDETDKNFIVYTDRTFNQENKLRIYYSLYETKENNIKLIKVTSAYDQKIGLQLIEELVNDSNK